MHQIDFKAGWANQAAETIVKVIATVDGNTKLYTIYVGGEIVALKVPPEDPRVALAQKISADLPAQLVSVAEQAIQFGKPLAFRISQDPNATPGK
jgi:hypothetical protein